MATIIESALWTVTSSAAARMKDDGLIVECSAEHKGILEIDKPIYHRAVTAPEWFGLNSIHSAIISYQDNV